MSNIENNNAYPTSSQLEEFIAIFCTNAGLRYQATSIGQLVNGKKTEAKYFCVEGDPDEEDFAHHLSGEISLSLLLNNSVNGGPRNLTNRAAVDIDDYSVKPEVVAAKLQENGIPAVLTTSKSGGIHVHLFFDEYILCKDAKALAAQVGTLLGFGFEVFPKQDLIDYDPDTGEGNKGNGLNLCYCGDNRVGWSPEGPLPLDTFLADCRAAVLSSEQRLQLAEALPSPVRKGRIVSAQETAADAVLNTQASVFYDGPPCLQKIEAEALRGNKLDHHRNNFLYDVAVFAKFKGVDDVDKLAEDLNGANFRFLANPLPQKEVHTIAKSVLKAEGANFKCREDPICGLCNSELCKTRRFGKARSETPFYGDVAEDMKGKYFVVNRGGEPVVMSSKLVPSRFHTRHEWETQSFGQFRNSLINRPVTVLRSNGKVENSTAGDAYLKDPTRMTYAGVVLDPENEWPDHLNLWRGFSVKPKQGDWSLFKEHIRKVICGGNRELFDYVLGWMAWKVQNPCSVPGVALVLRGGRGVGKNTFFENFGKLFGQHFYMTAHGEQVMGRFNDHLMDCCVLGADEAFWAGDKRHEGVLKAMITGEQLGFEGKGRKAIQADNHLGLIVSSNNDYVVPAGLDERRFCVMDVSEQHKQDDAYFKPLRDQMDAGGREAMLYDLQKMDLSAFNIRKVPQTKALADQKLEAAEPFLKWLIDVLTIGEIEYPYKNSSGTGSDDWSRGKTFNIEKARFFDAYTEWRKQNQRRGGAVSKQKIGLDVAKYLFDGGKVQQHRESKSGPYIYELPPLEEARLLIEKCLGSSIDWGEGDDNVIPFEKRDRL